MNYKVKNKNIINRESESIEYIESEIISICESVLEVNEVMKTDNFFDMGGNSLKLFMLIHEINEKFSVYIAPDKFLSFDAIEDIVREIFLHVKN